MERKGIGRIVVGVDGSEHGSAAVAWALSMARGMGSEVIAVFAVNPSVFFDTGYVAPTLPVQFDPAWRAEIQREFETEWCKPLKDAGVRYRAVMGDGRAASVLSQVAEKENADLILVGRRGRGGVASLLLGSVSHELVLHSKRPVFVISNAP